ncbi:S8 family serine peptidase [Aliiglaciecola sp. M165]|uniref:S8 family serine peptidase n=1 Tax=Aliiglaciecola sp. M165 TaxID=2593649 RepID=UPI00117CE539|nr:S8 family serine peptidase [Aliiglaciecola sp. M165]TRY32822.1 S8 family serine peptidase [Aliiglaciecola sp. M165]
MSCIKFPLISFVLSLSIVSASLVASDDPLHFRQWQFEGNSVDSDPGGYRFGVLETENALGQGEENVVMIISFGSQTSHEDLQQAFWNNANEVPNDGVDNDSNGYIDDVSGINIADQNGDLTDNDGWGTSLAGIIAAQSNNGLGIRGISPATKIVSCKVPDNFNAQPIIDNVAVIEECVDYAIQLKNNGVNLFAISISFSIGPGFYTPETEDAVKLLLSLSDKIESNDLLFISGMTNTPDYDGEHLDFMPIFPFSLHSPNIVSASRLKRGLSTYGNYGRSATTSIVVEDTISTVPFEKYVSNGDYVLEVTPASSNVTVSDWINIIEHPDDSEAMTWHIEPLANNGGRSEIVLPAINLAELNTSKLLIDVSLKRIKRVNSLNPNRHPIYTDSVGFVNLEFRVVGTEEWQIFTNGFAKARGIWDLYTAELDLSNYYFPPILSDSVIELKLVISGDETYVDRFHVWEEDNGLWVDGYDYVAPGNPGEGILTAMAAVIKSHNNDWPAWKIANALASGGSYEEFFPNYRYPINIAGKDLLTLSGNNQGALDCENKVIQRRLLPSNNHTNYAVVNEAFKVKTKSINCEQPGEQYTYTDSITGDTFQSRDDGLEFDVHANDGMGILTFSSSTPRDITLTNPLDYDLNLIVLNEYQPVSEITAEWVVIDRNVDEQLGQWENSPVELRLGGVTTDISKSFSFSSGTQRYGLVTSESPFLLVDSLKQKDARLKQQTKQPEATNNAAKDLANSNPVIVEHSNSHYDDSVFVDKHLNSVRIYAAPVKLDSYASKREWIKGEAPNRNIIVAFGDFIQIVLQENEGSIQFNFGSLPADLEGEVYEIGIEVGLQYRQKRSITLTSNTSYFMDLDSDGDGLLDSNDHDNDNDGVDDNNDIFPYLADESRDFDRDGLGDNADSDDDNDGVLDAEDAFPFDTDNDGFNNDTDNDDDNDGINDDSDLFPLDPSESADFDGDGVGDNADRDDDNDGVEDEEDSFPFNPSESLDSDADGIGNHADIDDDSDGILDAEDLFPLDTDNDGMDNRNDTDDDGDGTEDLVDDFPYDPSEATDTDGDGIGNNSDADDDGDGTEDSVDAYPLDSRESADTDGDGIGNNSDADDDGDGAEDSVDAFPLDPTETTDTDGDGTGNNTDTDDDGDGSEDSVDAFPLDPTETTDTDRDGIGNNKDEDDDGDGTPDVQDAFPLDSSRASSQAPVQNQSESGGVLAPLYVILIIFLLVYRRSYYIKKEMSAKY